MAHRLQIDISFNTESEMKSLINLIQEMRGRLIKQGGDLAIPCKVKYHQCNHDIGGPCLNYKTIEFSGIVENGFPAEDIVPVRVQTAIRAPLKAENSILKAENASLKTSSVKETGGTL